MSATKLPELPEMKKSKEKILPSTTRHVTDKLGLILFFTILLSWICTWLYAIYLVRDSIFLSESSEIDDNTSNINLSHDAINTLASSINSTIHLLNNNQLFRVHYILHIINFTKYFTITYCLAQYFWSAIELSVKCEQLQSATHYVFVNTGKLIMTTIFSIIFFSIYGYPSEWVLGELFILWISDLCSYSISLVIICCIANPNFKSKFKFNKSVVRYYMNCRNLILFQIFNLAMIIMLLLATVAILSKNLFMKSELSILFLVIENFYMILFLKNYAKMVTMAVSASHDWNKEKSAVSLKQILSVMHTIGKYHLGTICLHTLFFRRCYTLRDESKLPQRDVIVQHFGKIDILPLIVERSTILTAIHGQDYEDATTNIIWFEVRGKKILEATSTSSIVWNDIAYHAFTIAMMYALILLSDVEHLILRIIAVGNYLAIRGMYNYIVTVMDTINYTIEFCKEECKRNGNDREQSKFRLPSTTT